MSERNMFETATRLRLRWASNKGMLSVEDLWALPLRAGRIDTLCLDMLAKQEHEHLQKTAISFVDDVSTAREQDTLRLDILKHIIAVKKAEAQAASVRQVNLQRKQQLLGLLAQKENEELASKSKDDILKLINEL